MNNLREIAKCVRELPLIDVVPHLGGIQDVKDRQRWDFEHCSVWLGKGNNSQRFYDHRAGKGGGGAIDLVMYIQGCDFKDAVSVLSGLTGQSGVAKRQTAAQPPVLKSKFIPPKDVEKHMDSVLMYLIEKRKLSKKVVESLINSCDIYADSRRNAVFLCHDIDGAVSGAELRGTGSQTFKGMAPGSKRATGFFTIPYENPTELIVVESAIDALSYKTLFPASSAVLVSTAGVMPGCPILLNWAEKYGVEDIVIAYDSDEAGNLSSEQLMTSFRSTGLTLHRRAPWWYKDWNEIVQNADRDVFCPPNSTPDWHDYLDGDFE